MILSQYRNETLRTLRDLGSPILNSIHMTSGMMTEIVELIDCISPEDILDESSDVLWYLSNYCHIHDLEINQTDIEEKMFGINRLFIMFKFAGELLDMDKKNLAYKKEYKREIQKECVQRLYDIIQINLNSSNLNIEDAMEKNIQKLKIRFPNQVSGELAINKNVEREKEVFKS